MRTFISSTVLTLALTLLTLSSASAQEVHIAGFGKDGASGRPMPKSDSGQMANLIYKLTGPIEINQEHVELTIRENDFAIAFDQVGARVTSFTESNPPTPLTSGTLVFEGDAAKVLYQTLTRGFGGKSNIGNLNCKQQSGEFQCSIRDVNFR